MTTDTAPIAVETDPTNRTALRLTRHIVGIGFAMLLVRQVIYGPDRTFVWGVSVFFCLAGAAIVTALVALFLTKSQAKHSLHNFILTTWVIAGLILFGQWGEIIVASLRGVPVSVESRAREVPNKYNQIVPDGKHLRPFDPTTAKQEFSYEEATQNTTGAYGPNDVPADAVVKAYVSKVHAIQERIRSGSIRMFKGAASAAPKPSGTTMTAAEVSQMEAAQTWWRDQSIVSVHLRNTTDRDLIGLGFRYGRSTCASGGLDQGFFVAFPAAISPGVEVMFDFIPQIDFGENRMACLVISSARGA